MPRMEQQLAQLMVKDVAAWTKGGTDCEVRKHMPPQPLATVVGKGNSGAGKSR